MRVLVIRTCISVVVQSSMLLTEDKISFETKMSVFKMHKFPPIKKIAIPLSI